MKRLLLLAAFTTCAGSTVFSQDLAFKIPEKAYTVASLKGEQLLRLSSVADFDTSSLGIKLLKQLSEESGKAYNSIDNLGINLSANSYYYYQTTDSISYNGLLIPLSDAKKIDSLFGDKETVLQGNGFKYKLPNQKSMVAWNGQMLFFLNCKMDLLFFEDSTAMARYGLKSVEEGDENEATDTAVDMEIPPYVENIVIKDSIASRWLLSYNQNIFDKKEGEPSVLNNTSFQHSIDKNAVINCWVSNLEGASASLLPRYAMMKYGGLGLGYGSFISKLYMDNEKIRISSELGLDAEKANMYKAIAAHKLNKKFLRYINSDSLIGFMSYAISTEAYLNNLPKLFKGLLGRYDEEIEMSADFMSLVLDEKAISDVVKGDALFILSGLHENEVSYKSYVYDEETFEDRDTMLTKKETVPDFLFMFSSDNTKFIERLLGYCMKKELVSLNEGIYSIRKTGKSGIEMHVVMRDGIVFFGTSIAEIKSIQQGTYKAVVDKQQKELMMKNNMTMFFNPKHLGSKMPEGELGEMVGHIKALLGGAGNVYVNTTGIKDGYVSVDLTADVPKEKGNALTYFMDMISQMQKLK